MMGGFKGRGNQDILVGVDSALKSTGHRKASPNFPKEGQVRGSNIDLKGGW